MFTRNSLITMADSHPEQVGDLADIAGATLLVKTKGDRQAQIVALPVAPGEYVELRSESGRQIKCSPRAKLMLSGGGFVYAGESSGATVETDAGPDKLTATETESKTDDLVSIRLSSVHAALVNGFWVLVD
jgi:hypothetical protein